MQVKLDQGRLAVPVQATVADVKLSGNASADATVAPARFKLSLGTHNSGLGNLADLLLRMNGYPRDSWAALICASQHAAIVDRS